MANKRVVLIILDGYGIGPTYEGNAVKLAKAPNLNHLLTSYPHTELEASGEAVGLPKGEDGNTETGHLNIGAGKIVYQDLPRINMSIASGAFFQNKAFLKAISHSKTNLSNLHLIGLIGQGGVHSSNDHLYALMRLAKQEGIKQVYLHLITDGRDSSPTSATTYLQQVEAEINQIGIGEIATVVGRYYAMDRDHRWERIQVAYDGLVNGVGTTVDDISTSINEAFQKNITDEFLTPMFPKHNGQISPRIKDNDAIIFYNYRIDRPRELTKAFVLTDEQITHNKESFDPYTIKYAPSHIAAKAPSVAIFPRKALLKNLCFVTMTEYEKNLPCEIAYLPEFVDMPLSRVVAMSGKRQLKLSESEKERFVTYYFNGQRELRFPGEDIDITPSPKVATYDLMPEMSGAKQTEKLIRAIRSEIYDLIVINYANPDMVAHTGNLAATIKAIEYVDGWIGEIYNVLRNYDNIVMLITADHGNAEELISLDHGGIDTEHSKFPVPLFVVDQSLIGSHKAIYRGILGDIAPTILKLMGISKPSSMSGRSLL
ncbi:MAG: 2,3-bisphosphoglycerate-independent phosphoglycerate mutase [bacterium]